MNKMEVGTKVSEGEEGYENDHKTWNLDTGGGSGVCLRIDCHIHYPYEGSYRSEYHYQVTVGTDSDLHNVTLYVTLPIFEEELNIGEEIVAKNASQSEGWDCDLVETEHGTMLKIHAEKMIPDLHAPPVPLPEEECGPDALSCPAQTHASERVSARVQADHDINTKNPAGNEPTLLPKYNLARLVYRMPHPEDRTPPACYDYESRIYANYTTSPDAEVSIHAELTGANNWWVYGWSGNEYQDWSA
ncbi:MAG: hypothetical protein C4B59_09915 [Candidatus Methanogaster sp.]|uniref:Uncharacterized protein n=1 Tax=Candidatus Methanogaster sp. TaxID=3386292 RepID=A0AC61L1S8_9EURY|nr:MAG: hypothetical protein C4B59_09915 [ANME-2 cluster archaeon]